MVHWLWSLSMVALAAAVVFLALRWKSGEAWENFLKDFATSPAAAGCAAILAAVIAARSFGKGLKHTQSEAALDRIKEREDAWWEKFEWVTDRIIPKDPKAEKLALPLALTLLVSLTEMASGKFQRDAAEGIKQHYLETVPTEDDPGGPSERDLKAEVDSLRAFRNATVHSKGVEGAVSAQIYDREGSQALIDAWEQDSFELELMPRLRIGAENLRPDAVLEIAQRRMIIEFKAWKVVSPQLLRKTFDQFARALDTGGFSNLVIVTQGTHTRNGSDASWEAFPGLRVVQWKPEDGPTALRNRIEDALALPTDPSKE